MKKICVVTGSRAEYGLLKHLMLAIKKSALLSLQLIVTGAHLSQSNGYTVSEIKRDLFNIDKEIDLHICGDSPIDVAHSTALAITGIAKSFDDLRPDLVLILGDRYEALAAGIAALYWRIPVGHIHGGEITEGAIDDAIRHSITKLSHLHFVANADYGRRVAQLGENPNYIFNVGGLGVDAISKIKLLTKLEVEEKLRLKFAKKNLLITYHPETIGHGQFDKGIDELLLALSKLELNINLIFTMPNVDVGNQYIRKKLIDFKENSKNTYIFESMGQLLYLSTMAHCDAVIGNSSSGLLEAPVMNKPTINIGSRQVGRLKAASVINCSADGNEIFQVIRNITMGADFNNQNIESPYGTPGASERILKILEGVDLSNLVAKKFNNIPGFYG